MFCLRQSRGRKVRPRSWRYVPTFEECAPRVMPSFAFNQQAAVDYADAWVTARNPQYNDYTPNDCANFVSQSLIAGGLDLGIPGVGPDDNRGCIPSCPDLVNCLSNLVGASNTVMLNSPNVPQWFSAGDVAVFGAGGRWLHSVIAVSGGGTSAECAGHQSPDGVYSMSTFFRANPQWTQCVFFDLIDAAGQNTASMPTISVASPTWQANGQLSISWTVNGGSSRIGSFELAYSMAGGPYANSIGSVSSSSSSIAWNVPMVLSLTVPLQVQVEGLGTSGAVIAQGTSPSFTLSSLGNFTVLGSVTQLPPLTPINNLQIPPVQPIQTVTQVQPPVVSIETPAGVQSGDVPISVALGDANGDVCSLLFEYSVDGVKWFVATQAGGDPTTGLSTSAFARNLSFVWNSVADLGQANYADVQIRCTPSSTMAGAPVTTGTFSVNNLPVPQSNGGEGNNLSDVIVSGNPSAIYGQAVTWTATVNAQSVSSTPTGTVQFVVDGSNLGAPAPLNGGMATLAAAMLTAGSHSVVGVYTGDGNFAGSTSTVFYESVDKAMPVASIGFTVHNVFDGQPHGATGTVTGVGGSVLNARLSYTDQSGTALTSAPIDVGAYVIHLEFDGDSDYLPISSTASYLYIDPVATTTAVSLSDANAVYGETVTLSATVTNSQNGTTPRGSVVFLDGTAVLGQGEATGAGTWTLATASLAAGSHSISAAFTSDSTGDFQASTSNSVTETVIAAGVPSGTPQSSGATPAGALSLSIDAGQQTLVFYPGSQASYTVTITVRDGTGTPVSGASISVLDALEQRGATLQTNGAGQASYVVALAPGTSVAQVLAGAVMGYEEIDFTASKAGFGNSPQTAMQVTVEASAPSQASPAPAVVSSAQLPVVASQVAATGTTPVQAQTTATIHATSTKVPPVHSIPVARPGVRRTPIKPLKILPNGTKRL